VNSTGHEIPQLAASSSPITSSLSVSDIFLSTLISNKFCDTHIEWIEVFLPNLAVKKTPRLQRHLSFRAHLFSIHTLCS